MSIKDFDILNELGKGTFGSVYKVKRKKDNEIYALKKVYMNKLKQKEKDNSLNEVRILASINHPNVIAYKDAFYDNEISALCVIMEHADGGDLEKKIELKIKTKKYFSEEEILKFCIQITEGLKALHENKIMHRDIKAANIFMLSDQTIKIGDLNVSKVLKNSLLNTQTGTPYYASPEVWSNKHYDYKSDMWSLGCLIYELATLKAPFRGNSIKEVYDKVMKGVYDPIPNIYSKKLYDIISSLLMLNPILRPNCEQLIEKINNNSYANNNIINNINNISNSIKKKNLHSDNSLIKDKFNIVKVDNNTTTNSILEKKLLRTIKTPKRMFDLNLVLPKSKYNKRVIRYIYNFKLVQFQID